MGLNLDPAWVSTWILNGSYHLLTWTLHGINLDPAWVAACTLHGSKPVHFKGLNLGGGGGGGGGQNAASGQREQPKVKQT